MKYIIFIFFVLVATSINAQSPWVQRGLWTHEIIDRLDILYGTSIFTSNQNLKRKEIYSSAQKLWKNKTTSGLDRWDLRYLVDDNNEFYSKNGSNEIDTIQRGVFQQYNILDKEDIIVPRSRVPWLGHFYKSPSQFYQVDTKDFSLRVNPVINFTIGNESENEDIIFQNTRGLDLRAYLDKKVYIQTSIYENQQQFLSFHRSRIDKFGAIPGNGLYKTYNSRVSSRINGYDFLNAQAYIGVPISDHFQVELGHGRHHIGNGIRSLLLSDHAHNYFYLKFNTQIWKFHYQNIFAELAPLSGSFNPGDNLLPKKYMANHYLSFMPSNGLEIGVFETVVFARENIFELQYLNPVILYRSVEQFLDSPDNVIIGLNLRWNAIKKVQLYGQLVLDEFKLNEFTSGTGWWANKYGYQLGIKYINVAGIDHLDAQIELNTVRPYTYSHRDTLDSNPVFAQASYSHYNQPLAHPLGANFREILVQFNYRPTERIQLLGRFISSGYGEDASRENWGGNILLPHGTREMDFNNEIGQGNKVNINSISLTASYMFYHNYLLDFHYSFRSQDTSLSTLKSNVQYLGLGLRLNIGLIHRDY